MSLLTIVTKGGKFGLWSGVQLKSGPDGSPLAKISEIGVPTPDGGRSRRKHTQLRPTPFGGSPHHSKGRFVVSLSCLYSCPRVLLLTSSVKEESGPPVVVYATNKGRPSK